MADAAATRLALVKASEQGLPRTALPALDQEALDEYLGELSLSFLSMVPRHVRRTLAREHEELLHSLILRCLGTGFWTGAAYVVQGDSEG